MVDQGLQSFYIDHFIYSIGTYIFKNYMLVKVGVGYTRGKILGFTQ